MYTFVPQNNDPLSFIGNAWSLWPPHNERGGMNIVRGIEKINSDILTILLSFKGELPIHYDIGVAVPLFAPSSDPGVKAFAFYAAEAIAAAQKEITDIAVEAIETPDFGNELSIVVRYRPITTSNYNVLTFGYYQYIAASSPEDYRGLLASARTAVL